MIDQELQPYNGKFLCLATLEGRRIRLLQQRTDKQWMNSTAIVYICYFVQYCSTKNSTLYYSPIIQGDFFLFYLVVVNAKRLKPTEISLNKSNMTNEENTPFVRQNGMAHIYNTKLLVWWYHAYIMNRIINFESITAIREWGCESFIFAWPLISWSFKNKLITNQKFNHLGFTMIMDLWLPLGKTPNVNYSRQYHRNLRLKNLNEK